MSEWIESHTHLGEHPKVISLCASLEISKPNAIGHLHLLWHFAMKYAWRNGDLSKYSHKVISEASGWDKDPDIFIKALQKNGWLDNLIVHDWLDFAGRLVQDRLYNEQRRKTAVNSRKGSATDLPYRPTYQQKANPVGNTFTPPTEDQMKPPTEEAIKKTHKLVESVKKKIAAGVEK